MRIFGESDVDAERLPSPRSADELARFREQLAGVRSITAVASARGGVGKSAIVVNTAVALALMGRKVGILDADLNSPSILGMLGMKVSGRPEIGGAIEPASGPLGLRIVASTLLGDAEPPVSFIEDEPGPSANGAAPVELRYSATLRRMLGQTLFGALDLLLIDLGPGLEELYRVARIVPLGGVLLISHPSEHAARGVRNALEVAAYLSTPVLGVVENMVGFSCDRCHSVRPLLPQGDLTSLARDYKVPILARLPFDPRLAESCDRGALFVREYPDTPLAKQLTELAHRCDRMLSERASELTSA